MPALNCPRTGKPGRAVKRVTVSSLTREAVGHVVEGRDWAFCDDPQCDVVYFASDGSMLYRKDVTVRVGAKEEEPPHLVCYCFGHTEESIRYEVARTGTSNVVKDVADKVKAGECSCEMMNPRGCCCLGDLWRAVQRASLDSHGRR